MIHGRAPTGPAVVGIGRLPAVVLFVVVGLVLPAPARAATFCVGSFNPPLTCSGTSETTIGNSLAASSSNGTGLDTIRVAPGTYDEEPVDGLGNPVLIIGSGDATNIAPSSIALGQTIVAVNDPATTVSSLKITIPAAIGNTGIAVSPSIGPHGPSFRGVDVSEVSGADAGTGAQLYSSVFSGGKITMTDSTSTAARVTGGTLTGSTLSGYTGAVLATDADAASVSITRSRITAQGAGVYSDARSALAADDLIVAPGAGAAVQGNAGPETLRLANDTLIGSNLQSSEGAQAGVPGFPPSHSVTLNVDSTIIRGFASDLAANGAAPQTATLNVSYSDYDPATVSPPSNTSDSIVNQGVGNVNVNPLFAKPGSGDYSLGASSPVIDVGDPAAPATGEPATDAAGKARKVDGHHSGIRRVDMGAFEFQPPNKPPVAAFSAPAHALVGKPVKLDGSASHDPDGDPITFVWALGDGAHATAKQPRHAFARPGLYHVRLIVTDEYGAVSPAITHTIAVARPAPHCIVPRLRGDTLSAAKRALRHAHCALGHVTHRRSQTIAKGGVISTSPKAATNRPAGTKVNLVLSSGR